MKKKIWFAIALLIIAAFIMLGALGYLGSFKAGQIVLIGFMALIMFEGIKSLWFGGIFCPLGILYINLHETIGVPFIGIWPTIGIMLCLSVAFDIFFDSLRNKNKKGKKFNIKFNSNKNDTDLNTTSESNFYEMIKASSKVKYINSNNFESAKFDVYAGNMEIYLNKVIVPSNKCTINVDIIMGNLELYIPEDWEIVDNIEKVMANIDDNGPRLLNHENRVTLILTGSMKMGNIDIIRT